MEANMSARNRRAGTALEVLLVFFKLGLTSFGGPVAHIGYFRREFVERRHWLNDETFTDLVGLCQFLPGPASSQAGFSIGLLRAGWLAPSERTAHRVFYRLADVHAALRRLERQVCPPDRIEVALTRAREKRGGYAYQKKGRAPRPAVDDIQVDWAGVELPPINGVEQGQIT